MNDAQKRRFTRINVARAARLDFKEMSYYPCLIRDLSLGGVYIFSREAQNQGRECRVLFKQSAPGSDLAIRANARVVREDKDGMAIEFTSMPHDSYMLLQMILLYEAEDPMTVSLEYSNKRPFQILDLDATFRGQSASIQ